MGGATGAVRRAQALRDDALRSEANTCDPGLFLALQPPQGAQLIAYHPGASEARNRQQGAARKLPIRKELVDVNVLDADMLVAAVPEATEGLHLP